MKSSMFSVYPLLAGLYQQKCHMDGDATFTPQNDDQRALIRAFDAEHERVAELLGVQPMVTDDLELLQSFVTIHTIWFPGIDPCRITIPRGTIAMASVLDVDIMLHTLVDEKLISGKTGMQISGVRFFTSSHAQQPIAMVKWAGTQMFMTPRDGVEGLRGNSPEEVRLAIELMREDLRKSSDNAYLTLPRLQGTVTNCLPWLNGLRVTDGAGKTLEVGQALCGIGLRLRAEWPEQSVQTGVLSQATFDGPLLLWVERLRLADPLLMAVLYAEDSWA